jgi:ATP-dependent Clp protease ATP-binding subunit ClpB
MTSNLGSNLIQEFGGDDTAQAYTQMKASVMAAVQAHFRPEFINRLDEIVVFHPLRAEQIRAIAAIQVQRLVQRLAERDIGFAIDDEALDLIGQAGFDPVYGARPLKRAIQQQLENPLAQQILAGTWTAGDSIRVVARNGQLAFERGPA